MINETNYRLFTSAEASNRSEKAQGVLMLAGAGQRFSDWLVGNGTIKAEDKGIYAYGAEIGLASILNFITTLAIGYAFGMVWATVVFLVAYVPLRSYAGGYHASTHLRCGFFFAAMIAVVLGILSYMPVSWYRGVAIFATIVSTLIIAKLAPVEDKNKPLDEAERIVYADKTGHVLSVEIFVAIILLLFGIEYTAAVLGLTMASVSCVLVLGAIKNKVEKAGKR